MGLIKSVVKAPVNLVEGTVRLANTGVHLVGDVVESGVKIVLSPIKRLIDFIF